MAVQIAHEMDSGYTRPCVFACEDVDGRPAGEYVVKFGAGCRHGDGLLCELVAWELATILGLPVPQAAFVDVPSSLRAFAPNESIVRSIANGCGLNFGTAYQRGVRTQPMGYPIPVALHPLAERIFFFDLLIENWDRMEDNPNLLFRRDHIMLIDHESAFFSARQPQHENLRWVDAYYHRITRHLFHPLLNGREINEGMIRETFSHITRARWRTIDDRIPKEWRDERFNRMQSLIFDKIDNLDSFLGDVQGVLS